MTEENLPPISVGAVSLDAVRVFQMWATFRQAVERRRLSEASVTSYRSIWDGWCAHLAKSALRWDAAAPEDVRDFLQSLSARATARGITQPSTVTQSRYFKVLREIYASAVAAGALASNPVDSSAKVSPGEAKESLAFNAADWRALFAALPAPTEPPAPERTWLELRDYSILLLLMQAGLTVAEVASLRLDSVIHPRWQITGHGGVLGLPFMPWEAQASQPTRLRVDGARAAQSRTLVLGPPADLALLVWLSVRQAMPAPAAGASWLYVSRKKAGQLTARALFHLVNQHIMRVLGPRYGDQRLAHAGPMALRNSCIVRWLDEGVPEHEVLAHAGLKDLQALRRLQMHVHRSADLRPNPSNGAERAPNLVRRSTP
jgi:integrase/recombinase XerC